MPLYNWDKCMQGELKYVHKSAKSSKLEAAIWVKLFNEYLQRFGISEDFNKYLDTLLQLTQLRCAYVQTEDEGLLNQISIEEVNAERLDPSKHEGLTTDECLVLLSKWIGYHLKKREVTIVEFKNLLQEYGRAN